MSKLNFKVRTFLFIALAAIVVAGAVAFLLPKTAAHAETAPKAGITAYAETTDGGAETAATEETTDNSKSMKAWSAAIAIAVAAAAAAIAMCLTVSKSNDSIARQPEMESKIRGNTMLGLVFIETTVIYALLVCILIIFVL